MSGQGSRAARASQAENERSEFSACINKTGATQNRLEHLEQP